MGVGKGEEAEKKHHKDTRGGSGAIPDSRYLGRNWQFYDARHARRRGN
ncbi:unnamed protein product [Cylicostephanus goldi]|uniref:Uncharacterized protein n=1 Tax=Cylicostephanus goldi TaxID=71465 RepID=A0A3P6V171_CYLGO|nr:unnamed protein product [Cylicostephanus goldi]